MTIGIRQIQVLPIQAGGLVYQAATATPVVSATMGSTATGGLLQSPVPTLGNVYWVSTSTVSAEATTFVTSATQLAASGIKNLYLSDVVALCSNCIVITIQLAFSILNKSASNSFDLCPVSSTAEVTYI